MCFFQVMLYVDMEVNGVPLKVYTGGEKRIILLCFCAFYCLLSCLFLLDVMRRRD